MGYLLPIVGVVSIIAIVVFALYNDNVTSQKYAEYCHMNGMKSANEVTSQGKTSTTTRFCVDAQGFVHWVGAME